MAEMKLILATLFALQDAQTFTVAVEAGARDRKIVPVSVAVIVPDKFADSPRAILEGGGKVVEGQIGVAEGGRRELRFVLPELRAGSTLDFKVTLVRQAATEDAFAWKDGETWDELSFGKRPVMRYMRAPLDVAKRDETYKVFHHVYDPKGERFVTKGPGGKFPHHRGIYYGFNKVTYGDGKKCDVWHCTGKAFQDHGKTLLQESGAVYGRHQVQVRWHGVEGEVFAEEERELCATAVPGGTMIDFRSRLTPVVAPVKLDGDPQHAGFHFRADDEVSSKTSKQTYYVRPDGPGKFGETRNWPGQKQHVDLPWNAMSFVLGDARYTVAYLDHPGNPKEARFSERDYGRFGSYFEKTLEKGQTLEVRYRVWLQAGEMNQEEVAARSADFIDPPKVSVR